MKRFVWPLQRLLEVTQHREEALRAALAALAERMARTRDEIGRQRQAIRSELALLAAHPNVRERIDRLQVLRGCFDAVARRLAALAGALGELEERRRETIEVLTRTRAFRRTLQRLREESLARHARQQRRAEQKQLDEAAAVAFVAKRRAGRGVAIGAGRPLTTA